MAGADSDACKVTVQGGEGTTLRIGAGAVYIRGRAAVFDGTETVTVSEDCKIVVRMNKSLEVRNFQLLALTGELVSTEDICDLELARAHLEPVSGGHRVTLTDTRTFLAYMGQPAYYPPDDENLPYVLWLYTLGFPMDEEQREAVEGNPSLMAIFHNSLGAVRSTTEDLQEGLAAHAGNRSNPHGVTAQQVGAVPLNGGEMTGPLTTPRLIGNLDKGQSFVCVTGANKCAYVEAYGSDYAVRRQLILANMENIEEVKRSLFISQTKNGVDSKSYLVYHEGNTPGYMTSYVGTGTNSVTLTFPFAPKIVLFPAVYRGDDSWYTGLGERGYSSYGFSILIPEISGSRLSNPALYLDVTNEGKTFTWRESSASDANNSAGKTYYVLAF